MKEKGINFGEGDEEFKWKGRCKRRQSKNREGFIGRILPRWASFKYNLLLFRFGTALASSSELRLDMNGGRTDDDGNPSTASICTYSFRMRSKIRLLRAGTSCLLTTTRGSSIPWGLLRCISTTTVTLFISPRRMGACHVLYPASSMCGSALYFRRPC